MAKGLTQILAQDGMSNFRDRRAIVVTVDGWGAGFLGPYGNTWLDTPACNRLASSGMLMEHLIVDAPTLNDFYNAAWAERHAALPRTPGRPSLAHVLSHTMSSQLITDAPDVATHPLADAFDQAELISPGGADDAIDSSRLTQMERLFAAAMSTMKETSANLTWIHSIGMNARWDAPLGQRELYRDEGDPPVPTDLVPPAGPASPDLDPDVIQGWIWAYAGQVALLDACLGAMLDIFQQIQEPALLVVMGTRGYGLAEHGRWGMKPGALHNEHLHVPLFMISNAIDLKHVRCQQLVQPMYLYPTILDWFGLDGTRQRPSLSLLSLASHDLTEEASRWPPVAVARQHDRWAIRTPVWHACLSTSAEQRRSHPVVSDPHSSNLTRLYLKPDDRWEVNDVADRCPAVVEELVRLAEKIDCMPAGGTLADAMPLVPNLLAPPD